MSYKAIICPITNIRPIENSDFIVKGTASGFQVIISKDIQGGTLGLYLPSDGQLSLEMARENNLHRHTELNIDPKAKAGFFDDNRRIRAQKLRGEISEGFWVELDVLKWTNANLDKLKKGDLINELNGKPICNKYYTPATRRMMGQGKGKNSKRGFRPESFPYFKEHWHTNKLRMMIGHIPEGAILSISEKCHGCVDKNTIIDTLEYGLTKIQKIVEEKLIIHVKSLNTITNQVEYIKIKDWYFYADDKDWYEIELEDGKKIEITGNNPVWLPKEKCYRRVDKLDGTEALLTD